MLHSLVNTVVLVSALPKLHNFVRSCVTLQKLLDMNKLLLILWKINKYIRQYLNDYKGIIIFHLADVT